MPTKNGKSAGGLTPDSVPSITITPPPETGRSPARSPRQHSSRSVSPNRRLSRAEQRRMGKRNDRSVTKDRSSVQDEDISNISDLKQPYTCTGNFQTDFLELCRRREPAVDYIPPVIVRPHRPQTPTPAPVVDHEKVVKGGKSKDKTQPVEPEPEIPVLLPNGELPEPPPKTYTTKDRFEYFKPCIQVEMENADKMDSVTEVYIRGWKVDESMMNILQQCWRTLTKLHTVNLWNTGLNEATLELLTSVIQECPNLKCLSLDSNPVKNETWHKLLNDSSPLQHLSLRYNNITDVGAASLATVIGNTSRQNQKLISLNLSGNRITDKGAISLADSLRLNRCLLSLSLANNHIGDEGAKHFAEILSRFALTHEEIIARRKLTNNVDRKCGRSPSPALLKRERSERGERPGSVRSTNTPSLNQISSSKLAKGGKGKKGDAKKEEDTKHDKTKGKGKDTEKPAKKVKKWTMIAAAVKIAKMSNLLQDSAKPAARKADKGAKGRRAPSVAEAETVDPTEALNPLLEPVDALGNGVIMMKGNMTLINLNLGGNEITEAGADALLHAVKYQSTVVTLNVAASTTSTTKASPMGLLRLSLQRNKLDAGGTLLLLNALLMTRDPMQKIMTLSDNP